MILGLDVGGTQTDAVLVKDGHVVAHGKTVNGADLLETLDTALDQVLSGVDPKEVRRAVFSTTLATNAIVEDHLEPAGMIVSSGPGMDPEWFTVGPSYHVVSGCMDHRGTEVTPIDRGAVMNAVSAIKRQGIRVAGVAGKFSVRNPLHELMMSQWITDSFSYVAMGHIFSGSLNFPRRVATTYLNAALHGVHHSFVSALEKTLTRRGITAPRYLLKPDGGTVSLSGSYRFPAQTAQSGPAASVMGALALDGCRETALILDVGGTTTDMAILLDGVPLCVPRGITLGEFRTSIRSLLTRSLGLGGDSRVRVDDKGCLKIGPTREGSAVAFGGPVPTPTDAMIVLRLLHAGDLKAARRAMEAVAGPLNLHPLAAAERILTNMAQTIALSAEAFLYSVNSRPVYTIHEVIECARVAPTILIVLGGPAPMLAPYLAAAFNLPYRIPRFHDVANAVGAAAARVTTEVTLQADTQRGTAVIPEAGLEIPIRRDFSMEAALSMAREILEKRASDEGASPDELDFAVTEKEEYSMVRGGARVGKNIRLKLTIVPGIAPDWAEKEQC
ncbi:MAG: hydantoinase/oxoprolinase family protein [Deltaproteobacteria bacterium]|nr:hydantoinase/oxoprolinase family protein [Deltaproteobacteria bacterium]